MNFEQRQRSYGKHNRFCKRNNLSICGGRNAKSQGGGIIDNQELIPAWTVNLRKCSDVIAYKSNLSIKDGIDTLSPSLHVSLSRMWYIYFKAQALNEKLNGEIIWRKTMAISIIIITWKSIKILRIYSLFSFFFSIAGCVNTNLSGDEVNFCKKFDCKQFIVIKTLKRTDNYYFFFDKELVSYRLTIALKLAFSVHYLFDLFKKKIDVLSLPPYALYEFYIHDEFRSATLKRILLEP